MNIVKRIVVGALVGIGIGNIICLIFSSIYGEYWVNTPAFVLSQPSILAAAIKSNLGYALIGTVGSVSSVIFGNVRSEGKDNLLARTLSHFILLLVTYFSIFVYFGWINLSILQICIALAIFVIIYFIIWTANYIEKKKEIQLINEKIMEVQKNK